MQPLSVLSPSLGDLLAQWLETTRGRLVFGGELQSWIGEQYRIEEVVVPADEESLKN